MAGRGRRAGVRVVLVATALVADLCVPAASAWASSWSTGLGAASAGEGEAQGAPPAPTGVTSSCVSGLGTKVSVTWNAVVHAGTYTVYESTTSAASGYSVAASGLTATSWTSGNLAAGGYWFEVAAVVGANWASPDSSATAERTIGLLTCA